MWSMRVAVEAGKVEGELLTGSTLLLWLQLVLSPSTISGDLFAHAYLTQDCGYSIASYNIME